MPSELDGGIEATAAFVTSSHDLSMNLLLMKELRLVAFEELGAVTALMGTLGCMDYCVARQELLRTKAFATFYALKRFFTRMSRHVHFKV